jgi:hypothetical protein
MWQVKAGGFVAGFVATCFAYSTLFAFPILDARDVQRAKCTAIQEKLSAAANSAMSAAPAELNAAIRQR